jgi:hypothetical protein
MRFRSHLPNDCPPEDAKGTIGVVYRMIDGDTPESKDFLSFRELNPTKSYPSDCIASGLSVYTQPEGIRQLRSRVPRFRKMKVAQGNLQPEHGKMKNTPSNLHLSHHTWWIADDCEPATFFAVVEFE